MTFKDTEVDGVRYLDADMHLQTSTAQHSFYVSLAILFTLVYPVGVPAALGFILWWYRNRLKDGDTQRMYGSIYAGVRTSCVYQECVELLRKLLLSSVIIFVRPSTSTQIASGLLVSIFALCYQCYGEYARPLLSTPASHVNLLYLCPV